MTNNMSFRKQNPGYKKPFNLIKHFALPAFVPKLIWHSHGSVMHNKCVPERFIKYSHIVRQRFSHESWLISGTLRGYILAVHQCNIWDVKVTVSATSLCHCSSFYEIINVGLLFISTLKWPWAGYHSTENKWLLGPKSFRIDTTYST